MNKFEAIEGALRGAGSEWVSFERFGRNGEREERVLTIADFYLI